VFFFTSTQTCILSLQVLPPGTRPPPNLLGPPQTTTEPFVFQVGDRVVAGDGSAIRPVCLLLPPIPFRYPPKHIIFFPVLNGFFCVNSWFVVSNQQKTDHLVPNILLTGFFRTSISTRCSPQQRSRSYVFFFVKAHNDEDEEWVEYGG